MATNMPPPSPRTEKRRLTGAPAELEVLASPSKRGTPSKNRSFFSTSGSDNPRTPADISWIREQAGTTPRALDRDFLAASPSAAVDVGVPVAAAETATKQASATATPTKSKMFNRRTWTKEENDQLHEGIASLGGPNSNFGKNEWNKIAQHFLKGSRTGTQCATHWKMVVKPALLKGVWSPEEDAVIFDCVARGVTDWAEVAAALPKRKPKHCRERWSNHLDPSLRKGPGWTAAEEVKLVSAVEANGTNWSLIARHFPGRHEEVIQQHWNELVFRNSVGGRRGRSGTDSGGGAACSGRGRAKASTLPAEPSEIFLGDLGSQDLVARETEQQQQQQRQQQRQQQAVTLTDREKALMDHAFKTGLNAAAESVGVSQQQQQQQQQQPPPAGLMGAAVPPPKGCDIGSLTLSSEEDDLFAPLTAALLRDGEGAGGCSPSGMPPPSPTCSPLKAHKQQPDYTSIGDQLGDGWVVDDDPALDDLYRSLDNIGESLFNEDNFELSFDFDNVGKPAPSCDSGLSCGRQTNSSKSWDAPSLLPSQEKSGSPFRQAAANAAATLGRQHSPDKRESQGSSKGKELEEACARAAAAAAAAAAAVQAAAPQPPTVSAAAAAAAVAATPAPAAPIPEPVAGPRVKQGFLRRLLFSAGVTPTKQKSQTPFSTVRGCLSEANAPPPPPPPPPQPSGSPVAAAGPSSPAGGGGENQVPKRRGQPLSIALFAQDSVWSAESGDNRKAVAPSLKHGKAEVKIPRPQTPVAGAPLSSLPANRLN